jgi:platelet-activating factor acetylhydrolase
VPAFQPYTGSHRVGTVDVEIPVSALPAPAPAPAGLSTVAFRIFYPCVAPAGTGAAPYWIPEPQHEHVVAYAAFMGASLRMARVVA